MIYINWVRYSTKALSRHYCSNCKKNRFFVAFYQEWYGWDSTCLKCGDSWADGERRERPFMRGWRAKAIEAAKSRYRRLIVKIGEDNDA